MHCEVNQGIFHNCVIAQNHNSSMIIAITAKKGFYETEKISSIKDEQHKQLNSTPALPIKYLTRLMCLTFFSELCNK